MSSEPSSVYYETISMPGGSFVLFKEISAVPWDAGAVHHDANAEPCNAS